MVAEPVPVEPIPIEPAPVEPTPEPIPVAEVAEPVPVEPTPEPSPVEPTPEPIPVEPTPEPAPVEPILVEPIPVAVVEVAPRPTPEPPVPIVQVPGPLGLAGDLDSPLWGDRGSIDLTPPPAIDPDLDPATRADRRDEAARRRRERAEGVADRRATDIRYLGRGVSEALGDRQGDRAKLAAGGLPALDSPAELAERLGIAVSRLRWLAFHAEVASRVHYVGFEVAKKGGGTRLLSAPHRSMAAGATVDLRRDRRQAAARRPRPTDSCRAGAS